MVDLGGMGRGRGNLAREAEKQLWKGHEWLLTIN